MIDFVTKSKNQCQTKLSTADLVNFTSSVAVTMAGVITDFDNRQNFAKKKFFYTFFYIKTTKIKLQICLFLHI